MGSQAPDCKQIGGPVAAWIAGRRAASRGGAGAWSKRTRVGNARATAEPVAGLALWRYPEIG